MIKPILLVKNQDSQLPSIGIIGFDAARSKTSRSPVHRSLERAPGKPLSPRPRDLVSAGFYGIKSNQGLIWGGILR